MNTIENYFNQYYLHQLIYIKQFLKYIQRYGIFKTFLIYLLNKIKKFIINRY